MTRSAPARRLAGAALLALALVAPPGPAAAETSGGHQQLTLARDTWRSFTAMTVPETGLPADNIDGDLDPASRSAYTSPTNIGSYLWSAVVAEELGLISRRELVTRARRTLGSVARLERHEDSGQFYNWYDPLTLEKLRVWPVDGSTVYPFMSSVDNAWMAAALMVLRNAVPEVRDLAGSLLEPMNFAFYYDPAARGPEVPAGLMRGGFWDEEPPNCSLVGNHPGIGADVWYTCHTYGAFASETRMIGYVAIALEQVPPAHYFAPWRTFPDTCDWGWQEQKPVGEFVDYLGVPVFEGHYTYRGLKFVPTWGGDMFEELMPDMFVPEVRWGRNSWSRQHAVYVRGQIEHGLADARYGYWGFSPSSDPDGGYREYGVDVMGLDGPGYTSDQERTSVDVGFTGCREAAPPPESYGDGVVTPHAVVLALPYQPAAARHELAKLRRDFDSYGPGGFYDAVAVRSGKVAKRYLALDQGMIMGALGNLLAGDVLRDAFTRGGAERHLRPVMAMEEFTLPRRQ
ncbi:glucoamylase family protein [Actinophytocola xanthii]|uniref:Cellobiose phosphorylase n=1 Tax=Actinophytocola xanthii TaxID=1912961 RepID=A0A1Q8CZ40_9PSEU|nr:glucoamylase family protein [Actinophytocola xanthii]OLF19595.1 cellobiose phosphorylase [Actinophytocola xanthii]